MSDNHAVRPREFRVRPVVRYIVTQYKFDGDAVAGSITIGEFDNVTHANAVAEALAKSWGSPWTGARPLKITWKERSGIPYYTLSESATVDAKRIVTEYVNPPIGARNCDWTATFEDYDPERNDPVGWGETESEAIAALIELHQDRCG